ncbi:DNA recombination protein rmuC-like protein [Paramagnetospirillum caucaseum]|uniref:DNA recombination protein RmuC homolog n=1 Tax=Paramagnetospirillum caucaseum TaxID=1244869 RepID=M3AC32_9PROT|nr:DNA recombination protein RmuC [Paramagnetospirillum caucaseum]EME70353.1 DNA recombination protein rmuC-like protein [Paramagnetospirillum caucaseum]
MDFALISAGLSLLALVGVVLLLLRRKEDLSERLDRLERVLRDEARQDRRETAEMIRDHQAGSAASADKYHTELRILVETKLAEFRSDQATQARALREEVLGGIKQLGEGIGKTVSEQTRVVSEHLDKLRGENTAKLEQMRQTVDEKLQGTLEKRLGESFKLVSDRLEQVHKGLGEMQSLAGGVGDLKRVLTNVKTRGTWGEVQLGNLLEQMLRADQYMREANCKKGSLERVDFAIRLPGKGDDEPEVLLPIDSKFPNEDYERLQMAVERADPDAVEAAAKALEVRIKSFARDIRDKYVNPPATTDFAILFLPTEGLYAEVLRRPGLVDAIQRDFKVVAAGPTTLGAILNAIQMGFQTLAIEKRSSEIRETLQVVKVEFGKYGDVLDKVKKQLQSATNSIEEVARRKRVIDKSLRNVEVIPDAQVNALLALSSAAAIEDSGEDEE